MSWQSLINPQTPVWRGVEEYAQERIKDLTATCTKTTASDTEIRQAQARIAELNALLGVPDRLKMQAQQLGATDRTQGY